MLIPVILSGGSGSRLWPLSREHFPKQFLPLIDQYSFFQHTAKRLDGLSGLGQLLVICNEAHRFLVIDQLQQIQANNAQIVLEPVGRNTAPAIAVAALAALEKDPDAALLILPADHLIQDQNAFHAAVQKAAVLAQQQKLVTFGVVPNKAETGYGYIKAGAALGNGFEIAQFVEKPDLATAQMYLESGQYYWNSGMFLLPAQHYLDELKHYAPGLMQAAQRAFEDSYIDVERDFVRLDNAAFSACPSDSIDYAVMEQTAAAAVVPLDAGWSDIGAWAALWELGEQDAAGNVCRGDVLLEDTRNSYLRAEYRLLAALGLDDIIMVETPDAVLVAHKDKAQDVKSLVSTLKQTQREEANLHREVHRPWGTYETLDAGRRFKVKRIKVKPGASLSMQMHYHRSEHWVVVSGTAKVTCGESTHILSDNQSTYIPLGTPHRLENPGKMTLEIIEVQSGDYLGEDDIVRFDDNYGR
jgi:mannose-1-phosphate guanylyltransferase/mannose-6-phosphate isomerase